MSTTLPPPEVEAPPGWGAKLRAWLRGAETGIIALAVVAGIASGLVAVAMGSAARLLHVLVFHPVGGGGGLSGIAYANPALLLLMPATGGLLLGFLNAGLARWRPRQPVDPIEANALHGGNLSLADGAVVAAQNIISNGFGASVGLEAGYSQAGGGIASRLGRQLGLRRADLRTLVACGAAGAIAAAFDAPLTGAFYAFELVLGTYSVATLAPVVVSAVLGVLVARALHGNSYLVEAGALAPMANVLYPLAVLVGGACGLAGIALMRGVTIIETVLPRLVASPILRPAVGGLAVGALALITPRVLSAGHGALHLAFDTDMPLRAVLILFVLKAAASAISIGAGFRGGLFFASLLLGALLGKVATVLAALGLPPGPDPLFLPVVGMSAFGAAVVGAPLAMTFLALETTGDFRVAGAVLLAVVIAAVTVRRLFGYSFATWRFHLRGETIRSAHDVGWLRDLTVGRMMRTDLRTVPADLPLGSFREAFPLGATARVVALDPAGAYAGLVPVDAAHAAKDPEAPVASVLVQAGRTLLPAMNAKLAMAAFEAAEADALAVLDGTPARRVVGLLTEAHLLRRYGEELDKRRQEETGGG